MEAQAESCERRGSPLPSMWGPGLCPRGAPGPGGTARWGSAGDGAWGVGKTLSFSQTPEEQKAGQVWRGGIREDGGAAGR